MDSRYDIPSLISEWNQVFAGKKGASLTDGMLTQWGDIVLACKKTTDNTEIALFIRGCEKYFQLQPNHLPVNMYLLRNYLIKQTNMSMIANRVIEKVNDIEFAKKQEAENKKFIALTKALDKINLSHHAHRFKMLYRELHSIHASYLSQENEIKLKELQQHLPQYFMVYAESDKKYTRVGIDAVTNVAYYETIGSVHGRYPHQEDSLSIGMVDKFHEFSKEQKQVIFTKLFTALQAEVAEVDQGGATAISAIISPNSASPDQVDITIANAGDSAAFYVEIDTHQQLTITQRLNALHRPDNPKEKARLKEAGVPIEEIFGIKRINGLAVTRAIGDNYIGGVSHEPEVVVHTKDVSGEKRCFVLVACDGMTEMAKSNDEKYLHEKLTHILKQSQHLTLTPIEIARRLTHAAMDDGSTDNISVCCYEIPKQMTASVFISLFDGHAGNVVSQHLGKHFSVEFPKVISKGCNLIEETIQHFRNYIEDSKGKLQIKRSPYHSFWQNVIGISLRDKIRAAAYFIQALSGEKIAFTHDELMLLRQGRLGKLVMGLQQNNQLPTVFKEAETAYYYNMSRRTW